MAFNLTLFHFLSFFWLYCSNLYSISALYFPRSYIFLMNKSRCPTYYLSHICTVFLLNKSFYPMYIFLSLSFIWVNTAIPHLSCLYSVFHLSKYLYPTYHYPTYFLALSFTWVQQSLYPTAFLSLSFTLVNISIQHLSFLYLSLE